MPLAVCLEQGPLPAIEKPSQLLPVGWVATSMTKGEESLELRRGCDRINCSGDASCVPISLNALLLSRISLHPRGRGSARAPRL